VLLCCCAPPSAACHLLSCFFCLLSSETESSAHDSCLCHPVICHQVLLLPGAAACYAMDTAWASDCPSRPHAPLTHPSPLHAPHASHLTCSHPSRPSHPLLATISVSVSVL
jgi:hypothetical protein